MVAHFNYYATAGTSITLQLSRGLFQLESSCFVFLDEFLYFGISHNRCHLCLCIFMKSY